MFHIKEFNLVSFWKWTVGSDVCAICRAHINEVCHVCQAGDNSDQCAIIWGQCNHSFHNCCMVKWIQRSNRCPLCQQEWKNCSVHLLK